VLVLVLFLLHVGMGWNVTYPTSELDYMLHFTLLYNGTIASDFNEESVVCLSFTFRLVSGLTLTCFYFATDVTGTQPAPMLYCTIRIHEMRNKPKRETSRAGNAPDGGIVVLRCSM
jgi:hypothetical protein